MTVLHDSAILALRGLLAATEGDIYTDAPECAASVEAVTVARNTATDVLAWADREAEQARVKALQDTARRLVNIEVLYNVSALVGDLRTLANECPHHLIRELSFDADDLTELCVRDPDADAYRDAAPQGLLVEADGEALEPDQGAYSPELVEAFRVGARELCNSSLGDKIEVPADAEVRECDGDGVLVQCWLYVHDIERASLAGEDRA